MSYSKSGKLQGWIVRGKLSYARWGVVWMEELSIWWIQRGRAFQSWWVGELEVSSDYAEKGEIWVWTCTHKNCIYLITQKTRALLSHRKVMQLPYITVMDAKELCDDWATYWISSITVTKLVVSYRVVEVSTHSETLKRQIKYKEMKCEEHNKLTIVESRASTESISCHKQSQANWKEASYCCPRFTALLITTTDWSLVVGESKTQKRNGRDTQTYRHSNNQSQRQAKANIQTVWEEWKERERQTDWGSRERQA